MENASKALIIAGAVLISILLISLGVMIYRNAADIANGNQMKDFEITAFNTKFSQYEGKKNGSQVKTLVQDCLSSNVNEENIDRLVSVYWGDTDSNVPTTWGTNNPPEKSKPGFILGGDPANNDKGGTSGGSDTVDASYTTPKSNVLKNGTTYNVTMKYSDSGSNKGLVDCIIISSQTTAAAPVGP